MRTPIRRLIVETRLDRRATEALMLELRMLARAHGLNVGHIDIKAGRPGKKSERPMARSSSTSRRTDTRGTSEETRIF